MKISLLHLAVFYGRAPSVCLGCCAAVVSFAATVCVCVCVRVRVRLGICACVRACVHAGNCVAFVSVCVEVL